MFCTLARDVPRHASAFPFRPLIPASLPRFLSPRSRLLHCPIVEHPSSRDSSWTCGPPGHGGRAAHTSAGEKEPNVTSIRELEDGIARRTERSVVLEADTRERLTSSPAVACQAPREKRRKFRQNTTNHLLRTLVSQNITLRRRDQEQAARLREQEEEMWQQAVRKAQEEIAFFDEQNAALGELRVGMAEIYSRESAAIARAMTLDWGEDER